MAGKIKRIWEAIDACFTANEAPLSLGQIVAWIGVHYGPDTFNLTTLKAQISRSCVNVTYAQQYNAPKILFYEKRNRTYARVASGLNGRPEDEELQSETFEEQSDHLLQEEEDQSDLLVGVEAQLRDYLAKNLQKIEAGLSFWVSEPPSVEYTIDGRRIDLLAKDQEGLPVVIELKRGKAYDRVVGQGLLYQALVARRFKQDRVRVILVGNEISEELRLAASRLQGFKLYEYELTMQLKPIASNLNEDEDEVL